MSYVDADPRGTPPNRWPLVLAMLAAILLVGIGMLALSTLVNNETNGAATEAAIADSTDPPVTFTTLADPIFTTTATPPETTTTIDGEPQNTQTTASDAGNNGNSGETTTASGVTTSSAQDPNWPVTTISLSADADQTPGANWEFAHDFGAVQQWTAPGGEDCIRLYSPITRDPANPVVTMMQQLTIDSCVDLVSANSGGWFVDVDEANQIAFLRYALPPVDPVGVWVVDSNEYEVPGFIDGEFWGADVYWTADIQALKMQDSSGKVVLIDLPAEALPDDLLRLYIGRPMALG